MAKITTKPGKLCEWAASSKGHPVVIVNEWSEVTEDFLREKQEEFSQKNWPRQKLYAPFWIQQVLEIQQNLRIKEDNLLQRIVLWFKK